jgi:DMSO/TMAO reductase YedYZ molybdopterin-dependent catalytic subunit
MGTTLPPGQRAIDHFPRFGVPAYAKRLPEMPAGFELQVKGKDESPCSVRIEDFSQLQRKDVVADFHCVTTWTRQDLSWSGYAFRDFYEQLFVPRARVHSSCRYLEFKGLDGYSECILLEDLLREDVLLADRLQGEPLSREHGAPIRLVAPHLYGYKNVKHICAIQQRLDFRWSFADRQTLAHPRGRVALEERGRGLPGPIYRLVYRALVPPTLWYYRSAEKPRNPSR